MEERLSKTKNSGVLRKRGEIELRAKFCSIDIFGGKSNSAEAVRAARAVAVGQERLQQVSSISFVLWPFFVGRRVNVITAKVFEPLGTLFFKPCGSNYWKV